MTKGKREIKGKLRRTERARFVDESTSKTPEQAFKSDHVEPQSGVKKVCQFPR